MTVQLEEVGGFDVTVEHFVRTDAEDAQRDIIRQARKLQDAGEIILASADGGGFV